MKKYIYGLKDPFSEQVIYVGQTIFKPDVRLQQHYWKLNEVKRGERNWTKLFHYLDDLLPNKPIPFIIKELDSNDKFSNLDFYEKYYIDKYIKEGYKLLNETKGGKGENTYIFKKKKKKRNIGIKISKKLKGKPKPPGFGDHLREIRLGKNNPMCKGLIHKIACYTKDGIFIRTFSYSYEIDDFIGKKGSYSNIVKQIGMYNRFPYGYMWKYVKS